MSMSNAFMDGVQESIRVAAEYAKERNITTGFGFIQNLCVTPFHGLGAMRNMAIMEAIAGNWDYLFLIDTDIRLDDPSVIHKLVTDSKLVISPFLDQSLIHGKHWKAISNPMLSSGQGIRRLNWIATNCTLFDVALFKMLGPRLFLDPMITDEESYIFNYLALYGVKLWQDTDVMVTMLRPPTKMWEVISGGVLPNPAAEGSEGLVKYEQ